MVISFGLLSYALKTLPVEPPMPCGRVLAPPAQLFRYLPVWRVGQFYPFGLPGLIILGILGLKAGA